MLTVRYNHIDNWEDKFLRDDPDDVTKTRKVEDPWIFVVGVFSMHVGINHITEDNAAEFYARCKVVEACTGNLMMSPDGDVLIDPATVERFIGVKTNAIAYTSAAFFRHVRDDLMKSPRQAYDNAVKGAACV